MFIVKIVFKKKKKIKNVKIKLIYNYKNILFYKMLSELQNNTNKPLRTLKINIDLKEGEKIEDYDTVFMKDINLFILKANKHIYYLKIIMFVVVAILYEFKYYNNFQLGIFSFIILFNIAFTQNTINDIKIFLNKN